MQFQIKEVVLWSKKKNLIPVRLKFETGKVNVITGSSRTGKSAIIPIIDYCLGSDKCAIPVNTIRNACEWFGIVVQTPFGEKLFARREPGNQKGTGDMFVLEGLNIVVPETITEKNSNVESVKRSLDELVGLTNLNFDLDNTGSGFKGRPSFRDLSAFVFQPQNIVANPDILFYKADTYDHREKLRQIFPYVLNAISAELLAKQHELADLRKDLRKKQRELENIKNLSQKWMAEIWSRIAEARELGLIDHQIPENASQEQLVEILRNVLSKKSTDANIDGDNVNEAIEELNRLRTEERNVSNDLSVLRKRLDEMKSLKDSSNNYSNALQVQRDRLSISSWLVENCGSGNSCPICGQGFESPTKEIAELSESLKEIEAITGDFSSVPAAFDREFEKMRGAMKVSTDKLKAVQIRIRALEHSSTQAKERQYNEQHVSRFLGALEEALKTINVVGADSALVTEVTDLQDRVRKLEKEVSEGQIAAKLNAAKDKFCLFAAKLLPDLDCERPEDPIQFHENDLTISVKGLDRNDYLWEIGSGSNWLSYHVAISLSLQKYFILSKISSVPSFLVYDQPSQVYFPKNLVIRNHEKDDDDPKYSRDEDVIAVRKLFLSFSKMIKELNGELQILVLDHAAEDVWGQIPDVVVVDEWRRGKKLIPENWYN